MSILVKRCNAGYNKLPSCGICHVVN